jgi:UDP-N-acetylglucosamine transferase subunit ALG13
VSRILVTVGTDHHPFQRLVTWADDFARRHPEHEVLIQYGTARPPLHGSCSRLLDHAQLQKEITRADVVICHGGPATITDVRRSGLVPICVPREPANHEHVDGHQLQFVQRVSEAGIVTWTREVSELDSLVLHALTRPRIAAGGADVPAGVRRVGELIGGLSPRPGTTTTPHPFRVIYIGGQGRSGTTLLERALGEFPGVVSIGETVHLWDRGLRDNELCGCGQPFSACAFWSRVGEVAFGGWDTIDADDAVALRFGVDRNRYLPLLMRPGLSSSYQRRHARYLDRLSHLYRAVAEVSGATTIIDSSKHASYAMLLSQMQGIDLRLLHVVRDSRAVAHAWTKTVARPEADGSPMPVYGSAKAAVLWDLQNGVVEHLRRRHPYARVRYEDFVQTPKDVLLDVALFSDIEGGAGALSFLDGDTLHLGPSHTVAGNPMRFASGDIAIRTDQSWQAEMPVGRRRFVGALTMPLQRRYGYGSGSR